MSGKTKPLALLLFGVLVLPDRNAAAQCTGATETHHVYVKLDGCALADPGLKFDVTVGKEIITVEKTKPGDEYWRGKTKKTFAIQQPELTIGSIALPKARAACDVHATPLFKGACVALYTVKCEPLWLVDVKPKKKPNDTTFTYGRKSRTDVVACETDPKTGPFPISPKDTLVVTVNKPAVEIPVTIQSFGRGRDQITLADVEVRPLPSSGPAAILNSIVTPDLAREKLRKAVEELVFTKKAIPDAGG